MEEIVKDFVGREIKAGQRVVYPVRRGSQMWLEVMNVQSIRQEAGKTPRLSGFNNEGRRTTVHNLENVMVIVE